jgi:peptide/nickel transport system permease protein
MTVLADALPRLEVGRIRQLRWNPRLVAGIVLLAGFAVLAVINPLLLATVWSGERSVYDPVIGHDLSITHPSGPSFAHWLGTDPLGRDVVSLVTASLWPSLTMAAVVAVTTGIVSLTAAAVAAFYRHTPDRVLTSIADATLLFPAPLMFLVVAIARPGIPVVALGIFYGLVYGLGAGAIVVRSRALVVMGKPFIEAARVAGGSPTWIISRHLVPHLLPYVAVQVLAGVTGALIVQGFVEYNAGGTRVGLGNLVYQAITYHEALFTPPPWSTLLAGGLTLSLLAATFYLMSSGLEKMLEPTPTTRS